MRLCAAIVVACVFLICPAAAKDGGGGGDGGGSGSGNSGSGNSGSGNSGSGNSGSGNSGSSSGRGGKSQGEIFDRARDRGDVVGLKYNKSNSSYTVRVIDKSGRLVRYRVNGRTGEFIGVE